MPNPTQNFLDDMVVKSIYQFSEIEKYEQDHFDKLKELDAGTLKYINNIKRFSQRWHGERDFREQVLADLHQAIADYNF